MKFQSPNWKATDRKIPELIPFLKMILADQKLTRIPVKIGNYRRAYGGDSLTLTMTAYFQPSRTGSDYDSVNWFMLKHNVHCSDWKEWQWEIMHEVAHCIIYKKRAAKKRRVKKQQGFLMVKDFQKGGVLERVPPHGKAFMRTLLKLAQKYPPVEKDFLARFEQQVEREPEPKAASTTIADKIAALQSRKKRWLTKLKRALNAVKKIDRQLKYQTKKAQEAK